MGSTLDAHGTLDIVETNPFKHLVHLSLKFVAGNDDEIKKYLAACLKSLQVWAKKNLETRGLASNWQHYIIVCTQILFKLNSLLVSSCQILSNLY